MLTKVRHKRVFYLSFTLFLGGWYILSAQEVVSFNFFKVWTLSQNVKVGQAYVKESMVDDTIVGTVIANISFGESTYSSDQYIHNALHLFEVSSSLVAVDVLELINSADNPKEALDSHMKHIDQTLAEIADTRDALEKLADQHLAAAEGCLEDKRDGDQLFFEGVAAGDQGKTAEGLAISLEFGPCYMQQRIRANAYGFLADRVATNYEILTRRQEILTSEGELLVQHTGYFEGDVLDRLVQVRQDLNQVNQVDYNQFETLFDFTQLYDLETVPSYDRMFFSNDQRPQF